MKHTVSSYFYRVPSEQPSQKPQLELRETFGISLFVSAGCCSQMVVLGIFARTAIRNIRGLEREDLLHGFSCDSWCRAHRILSFFVSACQWRGASFDDSVVFLLASHCGSLGVAGIKLQYCGLCAAIQHSRRYSIHLPQQYEPHQKDPSIDTPKIHGWLSKLWSLFGYPKY